MRLIKMMDNKKLYDYWYTTKIEYCKFFNFSITLDQIKISLNKNQAAFLAGVDLGQDSSYSIYQTYFEQLYSACTSYNMIGKSGDRSPGKELIDSFLSLKPPTISSSQNPDGVSCQKCKAFCSMAVPNQSDGINFICYGCRT